MLRGALLRQPLGAPSSPSRSRDEPECPEREEGSRRQVRGAEGLSGERGVRPAAPPPSWELVLPEQALPWGQVLGHLPSPPGKAAAQAGKRNGR